MQSQVVFVQVSIPQQHKTKLRDLFEKTVAIANKDEQPMFRAYDNACGLNNRKRKALPDNSFYLYVTLNLTKSQDV